ncbi:ArsR/SmtB family transcription factor [Nocardia cyriacigeorgica]|uniref:ArsR/SmtB family transcription factor n=1 Tax=Nocardia cyriacigeorgica TaxID=135487 RepID=UPI000CEA1456|nr:metalloregulator ArsR/SmtB family transcription factor [Nocardia cyriacigeorgica]AVH24687.1 transcriptional regulator [Nocardia cyriacigeorgica]MBF6289115.1 winged helix-turn-helix transcriptional regulator [Nocardia cyriacigeorgica]MBF6517949.1 winged helix-turn-helix transcriptional regulator [Nocardia cyriacigeorgica]PPJ01440.1 transcriptional regulator [Nocardia cyriacigeorgica]BDU05418.1 transcriptional regulator [Nocardia cyriacigeorgica]
MSSAAEKIFEALGDPVRRRILELVSGGEQPAGTIVAAIQQHTAISQPGVSQHLKVLRDAGLVTVRADGNRRLYAVDPAGVDAAQAWLAGVADPLAQFAQPLDALATEVARGKRARRTGAARPGDPAGRETRPA